ncbi:folylpolyglutamate synthase/dihydrofolate synthase family protein [Lentilactobacillus sp. Marseille-Q4993]|uniref:bifunctional folylpolyglutamate synthase/dihydrofolate synthase n=1 Tax=Lentilactobacillus sp. Marseille-Q4993 TaxID=3039492 RepID=UPI0024BCEE16|nr:folylpolyglutamate synthase/dihydrofolate synthase family protein [Lentilactobacillus sp. Marseille-Q4993]
METYDEALQFIHGRTKFKKIPTLKRMERFLSELGNPHKKITAIHVAGTNGKGSTVAYLRGMFMAEGKHVGTFTSPFLIKFNERISVDGQPISDDEILRLANKVYPIVAKLDKELPEGGPTEFGIITAMMFSYFAEGHADVVIVEVGLGGLLDSTNVVTPVVGAITSIGMDHMHILGDTLEKIAAQKAGIIKEGVPIVVGEVKPGPLAVIRETASKKHAPISIEPNDFNYRRLSTTQTNQKLDFSNNLIEINEIESTLIGKYQASNAAVAIQTYLTFKEVRQEPVVLQNVIDGIASTKWPGRFEQLSQQPKIYIDGAHNVPAATQIASLLKTSFKTGTTYILLSILADKQALQIVEILEQVSNARIVLTGFDTPGNRKLFDFNSIREKIRIEHEQVDIIEDYRKALSTITAKMGNDDMLLITGSLYFISEIRPVILGNQK